MMIRQPVLVVEQDAALRTSITFVLRDAGYFVLAIGDERAAFDAARENPFSLVLFDPGNMQEEGLAFCRTIRSCAQTEHLPIILMITRESQMAQVEQRALHITDYLLKPLVWEELLACVRAVVRSGRSGSKQRPTRVVQSPVMAHTTLEEASTLLVDDLRIDVSQRTVSRQNLPIELGRPLLFDLLVYFVRHPGIALTRTELLTHVWRYEQNCVDEHHVHTVSVHVHWLREALGEHPDHPQLIQTVRGVGYRFKRQE